MTLIRSISGIRGLVGDTLTIPEILALSAAYGVAVAKGGTVVRIIEIAAQIATMPPLAMQAIREAVRLGADVALGKSGASPQKKSGIAQTEGLEKH